MFCGVCPCYNAAPVLPCAPWRVLPSLMFHASTPSFNFTWLQAKRQAHPVSGVPAPHDAEPTAGTRPGRVPDG